MTEWRIKKRTSGIVLALAMVAAVTLVAVLVPPLRQRGVMVLLTGAVTVAAWYGGAWAAGVATVTSSVVSLFILTPTGSPTVRDPWDLVRLALFVLVAVLISSLHAARESAEERVRQSEQRLLTALEYARMGAWELNMRTGRFWWSKGLEDILGRPPGTFSLTYEGFIAYVHPEDRDFVERAVTQTVDKGTHFSIDHRIVRPDESVRQVVTRGRIFYDDENRCERIVAIAVDVTGHQAAPAPESATADA